MFRNCNQFNEFPCPETDCKGNGSQFRNHTNFEPNFKDNLLKNIEI